jgi:alkanesulfonate monooxygenase SsuD/methylene tetrahydromethanopterin reductase-like flavin-dependent oxidoreductase (luciferase family)
MMSWPKPVQKPHPPIIVGGGFPQGPRRAARYGDGWMPIAGRGETDWNKLLAGFRQICAEEGRDPERMSISIFNMAPEEDEARRFADAGVTRGIVSLPSEPSEKVLPVLDRLARLADSLG